VVRPTEGWNITPGCTQGKWGERNSVIAEHAWNKHHPIGWLEARSLDRACREVRVQHKKLHNTYYTYSRHLTTNVSIETLGGGSTLLAVYASFLAVSLYISASHQVLLTSEEDRARSKNTGWFVVHYLVVIALYLTINIMSGLLVALEYFVIVGDFILTGWYLTCGKGEGGVKLNSILSKYLSNYCQQGRPSFCLHP